MTAGSQVLVGRRDRLAVLVGLGGVVTLTWIVTVRLAADMTASMGMASAPRAVGAHLLLVTAMWAAMMTGMMVPSATPMVVTYTGLLRRARPRGSLAGSLAPFLLGYVLVWLGFSVFAAILQLTLQRAALLTPMGTSSNPGLGGGLLVLAGLFQLTSWKQSCLRRCRTPVGFLVAEWRDGAGGALVMGMRHGGYCLGCCWLLMAVLFTVGTMHLAWMAAIAVFVLVEKLAPRRLRVSHAAAFVLVGWGGWILLTASA